MVAFFDGVSKTRDKEACFFVFGKKKGKPRNKYNFGCDVIFSGLSLSKMKTKQISYQKKTSSSFFLKKSCNWIVVSDE